jgi:hypothetical protein
MRPLANCFAMPCRLKAHVICYRAWQCKPMYAATLDSATTNTARGRPTSRPTPRVRTLFRAFNVMDGFNREALRLEIDAKLAATEGVRRSNRSDVREKRGTT